MDGSQSFAGRITMLRRKNLRQARKKAPITNFKHFKYKVQLIIPSPACTYAAS
jgi:hypothetical protein